MVNNKVQLHAYAIPLLHAAKYPASDVCGALLGKNTANGLEVQTAVPFFHNWTTLTPMLEIALKQTDLYAKKNNLAIIGWYHGNARLEDDTLPERSIKVAETIKKNNDGKAIIFLLDNKRFLKLDEDETAIMPYVNTTDNQWKKIKEPFKATKSEIEFNENDTYSKVRGLFNSSAYNRIYDFDEHLEDVSLNWLDISKMTL
ncbi:uncharacterized protein BX663DRAFT_548067 [Cokeromyces recurvatus]|uniref:uncharacterized protein n=1 Tax=Cokeromyces recurvatus TaxID=90255 RepID=UPI0022202662|nr:uncharacterized protein BX663DRAFT_548067 [Cokeromyces recurvatus]KAI7906968.1 hypothetical protein BX663DRAFT_548067 [Cokeromyces recurvatus]